MRIVHVTTSFIPSGISQKEAILANAQQQRGDAVTVLAANTFHQSWKEISDKTSAVPVHQRKPLSDIPVIRLPILFQYADFVLCKGVESIVRKQHVDLWHLHEPAHGLPYQVVQKIRGSAPVVVDQHQFTTTFSHRWWVQAEYHLVRRHIVQRTYDWANAAVSVTDGGRNFLAEQHSLPKHLISIIPLGTRTTAFHQDAKMRQAKRRALQLRPTDFAFVTTGSLQPFKRIEVLLEAFSRAVQGQSNIRLLVVGEGTPRYQKVLRNLCVQRHIAALVQWLPFTNEDDLAAIYNAADCAVWPKYPTISISQAVACGLPIILSDHPSQAQYVRTGCALQFPVGDAAALQRSMLSIVTDDNLRMSIAKHNVEFAQRELSAEGSLRSYDAVYQQARERWGRSVFPFRRS